MKLLKIESWLNHPWSLTGMVEQVSIKLLSEIKKLDSTSYTDDLDGYIKHQSFVFDNIEKNGMRDPLLIVISKKNNTIRLESGNHRINEAISRGYSHLPCATLVIDESILHEANGKHSYEASQYIDLEKLLLSPYPYQIKLSDYLRHV